MASVKARLRALADEATVLIEKGRLSAAEKTRLDQIAREGDVLVKLIQQGKAIDGVTGRFGTPGDYAETDDGFRPGIGAVTGKAMHKALDATRAHVANASGADGTKAIVQSGSLLVPAARDAELFGDPMKATFVTDVIPTKIVESNDVTYLRQKTRTNLARVVADGAQKPTSIYTIEEKKGTLETVAHMSEYVTNRLFEDSAMLGGWLGSEMEYGLRLGEEAEAAAIILADPAVQTQTFVSNITTTVRKAVSKLAIKFVKADVLMLSIADAEHLDLATDVTGRFYYAGPKESGASPLWSAPVFITDSLPSGIAILANAAGALRRYVRSEAQVNIDNISHFDANETRMRLERRSLTCVVRPFEIVVIHASQFGS